MKKTIKISLDSNHSIEIVNLIRKLNVVVPENGIDISFSHWFSENDLRLKKVEQILHDAGWISVHEAYESGRLDCPTYKQWFMFDYGHEDIVQAPYATMFPMGGKQDKDIDIRRGKSGRLAFHEDSPLPTTEIVVGDGYTPVMTTRMKRQIEHQGWKHMVIRSIKVPQVLVEKATTSEHRKLPRWELNSDLELPPIYSGMRLTCWSEDSEPYSGDRSKGCHIKPSKRFPIPVPHYRASDLKRVGSFDIARTWEWFSRGGDDMRLMIVSKRVYEFFREFDVKNRISWEPVYVIEDE